MTKDDLDQFRVLAARWDGLKRRDFDGALRRVLDEASELAEAGTFTSKLDELGDLFINALRCLGSLDSKQMEYMLHLANTKADLRIGKDLKDKQLEAELAKAKYTELFGMEPEARDGW